MGDARWTSRECKRTWQAPAVLAFGLWASLPVGGSWAESEFGSLARGVVVEGVGIGSALEKAGLEAGDVLLSWQRLPDPPANPEGAQGEIESVFDWLWLKTEQAPRGTVKLIGEREGEPRAFEVRMGLWEAKVRAWMSPALLEDYLQGEELVQAGDFERGIGIWEEVAEKVEGREDQRLLCWLQLQIGEAWAAETAWEKAHAAYRSALAATRQPVARVAVWDAISRSYERQSDFVNAEASYRSSLDIRRATWGEGLSSASSLNGLGIVAHYRGELEVAADYYRRALQILEKLAPGSLKLAAILNNLGVREFARGDLELAAEYFRRALEIEDKLAPGSLNAAHCLGNLGTLAFERGDLEGAADYMQRGLEIQRKVVPGSPTVALSLNNLGSLALDQGELEAAADYLRWALEILEKRAPGSLNEAFTLKNLGELARKRGDLETAANHLRRALKITEKRAPGSLDEASALEGLGDLARERGELEMASAFHHRVLEIRDKLAPGSRVLAVCLNKLGVVARERGQLDPAGNYFDRSIAALEAQVEKLGSSQDVKGSFRAQHGQVYRDFIALLLQTNRPKQAFAVLERSRARSFLAMLAQRDLTFPIPEDVKEARRSLALRFERTQQQLANLSPIEEPEELEELHRQRAGLLRERAEMIRKVRRDSPQFAALQYPQPLEPRQAREVLDPGTVMLSYSVGKAETDLFVVTPEEELQVHTLAAGEEQLRNKTRLLRRLIEEALPESSVGAIRKKELATLSKRLYRLLVEPAQEAVATNDRVLIIPDGPLHLLPFAALIYETGDRGDEYLAEWKPLHSALSATVYAELKKSRRQTSQSAEGETPVLLAAFGDPHYPESPTGESSGEIADIRLRSVVQRGLFDFDLLPYSRREVEQIAALYPAEATRTYLGVRAIEENAKATGRETRIVHFAVHGFLDDRLPLSSGLALSMPAGFPEDRDNGLLQVWEIFERLRLDADLVVLSACETGVGQEQGGEGLIGLTRAFQYAGARTVAATLWKVQDRVTAELMARFHHHLRAGKPKDEALQAAQIELIRGPIGVEDDAGVAAVKDWSVPYYWAAFQLHGDWR